MKLQQLSNYYFLLVCRWRCNRGDVLYLLLSPSTSIYLLYNILYSCVASNDGHALLAKSRCPRIFAYGYSRRKSFSKFMSDAFCASVRVSFGI